MTDTWLIRDDFQRSHCAKAVASLDVSSPQLVTIKPWVKRRSDCQNRLAWMWYGEISKHGGEYTPDEIHRISKLTYGVPILRVDDEKFAEVWGTLTAQFPLYQDQWQKLMVYLPVTSLMDTKQMAQYLTELHRSASTKYVLTDPALCGLDGAYL